MSDLSIFSLGLTFFASFFISANSTKTLQAVNTYNSLVIVFVFFLAVRFLTLTHLNTSAPATELSTFKSLNFAFLPNKLAQAVLLSGLITSILFITIITTKTPIILRNALTSLFLLSVTAFCFVTTESLFVFFFCFELLLLISLYLLRLTSKSERVVDASVEMFFWTLFGSLALLTLFIWTASAGIASFDALLTDFRSNSFFGILLLFGFGVKIPVWPFFSWLLKAHVEASVEFSILLSGFIVKLGVYGLYKLLISTVLPTIGLLIFAFSLLGLVFASFRLFAQRDLKRIVALTTVIEMNWLTLALASGGLIFDSLVSYIVLIHSLTTSLEFFAVEVITKRFGTRDNTSISGLFYSMPLFATITFIIVLITIGFPGTPLFLAKFLFLTELISVSYFLTIVVSIILLLVLPLFFIKLWVPIWFGLPNYNVNSAYDLTKTEFFVFSIIITAALMLAFFPSIIL